VTPFRSEKSACEGWLDQNSRRPGAPAPQSFDNFLQKVRREVGEFHIFIHKDFHKKIRRKTKDEEEPTFDCYKRNLKKLEKTK
jgi:hypothetical protein